MIDNSPPPATQDSLPAETARRRRLEAAFSRTAESYGFEEVATPIFERADLFEARSGPEIRNALLAFHCDHEEYALRPELTAPVCRMVASGAFEGYSKPYKLYYMGPCFRYCRPHSGRQREFIQAGIELLGDASPGADAEVIAAAHRFLRDVGLGDLSLTIGTAGIVRSLLPGELSPDERATVIGHLDRLSGIDSRCAALAAGPDPLLLEQLAADRRDLAALQAQDGYEGEFAIESEASPEAADIARRLPEQAAATFRHVWNVESYMPDETAELLIRVSRIQGTLEEVAAQADATLEETEAADALSGLMAVCRSLEHYGITGFKVSLGIARGLTFYTGTVFEIGSGPRKLCGGGRYDRLVELFGGQPTPATGCAIRFDMLEGMVSDGDGRANGEGIAVQPAAAGDEAEAVLLAEALRNKGLRVGAAGAPAATVAGGQVRLPDGGTVRADADTVLEALGSEPR